MTEYRNAEKKKIQTNKEKAELILRRFAAWMFAAVLVIIATGGIILSIVYASAIRQVSDCLTV